MLQFSLTIVTWPVPYSKAALDRCGRHRPAPPARNQQFDRQRAKEHRARRGTAELNQDPKTSMIPALAADVLAILQARVSSSRLPGKVLMPIVGQPMLRHELDRVRRARTLDALVVATSAEPGDDPIAQLCTDAGVDCFRGSLDDVLDRFYQAALAHRARIIVRLTGDCPLVDPALIDRVVEFFRHGGFDLAATADTFPDGVDVEAMRYDVLEQAWADATKASDREHVTLFVRRQPGRFRIGRLASGADLSHMRWSVDEREDLEFVRRVYDALYPANPAFTTEDVLALLAAHPHLAGLNRGSQRNEGLRRSLAADPPDD
jgi:spore coat polysaccharide biosynthesis protein SpsF